MNLSEYETLTDTSSDFNGSKSFRILETSRKVNIFSTLSILIIGIIGHFLTIFVFGQRRFRTNSCNVLLLCLAVNDVSFLLIHFFEDTLRTYRDIYIDKENSNTTLNSFVIAINLIDKSDLTCRIVNYLRYVLRFISSYILVAFTLQRLLIIFNPMTSVFRHKKSAWITVLITVISSFLINFWALFLFEIQTHEDKSNYCDIKKRWSTEYVLITAIYICLTLFIPIIIILGTNLLIILNLQKSEIKRKECNSVSSKHQNNNGKRYDSLRVNKKVLHNFSLEMKSKNSYRFRIKPYYSNINKIANKTNNSKNSTRILLTISFVFILLNLPYLISWILFYYRVAFRDNDPELKDYLFATLQISEIFYISNYAISFYLYCISGSKFRNQLKYSIRSNKNYNAQVEFYVEDIQSSAI